MTAVLAKIGNRLATQAPPLSLAWWVLAVSLLLSVYFHINAARELADAEQALFERRTDEVTAAVIDRMQAYEQVLRGARGLFAASGEVNRKEWKVYVESLDLQLRYPGIQGVGFTRVVPARERSAHVKAIRAEGFAGYDIRPPGARDPYTAIIYLEPFDWRNQRAFGFDMFSEPVRRAAMERARDGGAAALSGKVTLVQEAGKEKQAGVLMYLPVYRNGSSTDTLAGRRAALTGYVYSPFRMNNLMAGILGEKRGDGFDIDIEAYDGETPSLDNLLYDDDGTAHAIAPPVSRLGREVRIGLNGRVWTLYYTAQPAFYAAFDGSKPWRLLLTGMLVSGLLFGLVWLLATQRRRAQDLADSMSSVARANADRVSAILDNVIDAIITIDENGIMGSANPAAERIFGYSQKEMVGRNVSMLMPEPYHSQHDACLKRYRETGVRRVIGHGREVIGQRADGTTFPLELSVSELKSGSARLFIGVVRDLSERKKVERLKSEFVSTVSHELRTPLTAIQGSLGLIGGGAMGALPAKAKELIDIAHRNCERLTRLVNDLLDIEKIESGRMQMNLVKVDILPLVRQALEANAGYAASHQVRLQLAPGSESGQVEVDVDRLAQVMANLLSNAVKFSSTGGAVEVSVVRAGNRIRVNVRDHGQGIPDEFRDRIFSRFAQADASDARQKGGTGLGLSISRAIVQRLGGEIGYESRAGVGTTFHILLPLTDLGGGQ